MLYNHKDYWINSVDINLICKNDICVKHQSNSPVNRDGHENNKRNGFFPWKGEKSDIYLMVAVLGMVLDVGTS